MPPHAPSVGEITQPRNQSARAASRRLLNTVLKTHLAVVARLRTTYQERTIP